MAALNSFLARWLRAQASAAVVAGVRLRATARLLAPAPLIVVMGLLGSLMTPLAQLLRVPFKVTVRVPLRIWPRSFRIVGRRRSALRLHRLGKIGAVNLILGVAEEERLVLEIGSRRLRPLGHDWRPGIAAMLLHR